MLYSINATMNGNKVATNKLFKTWKEADKYINGLLDTYYEEVQEELDGENGHEYICNDYSRIFVKEIAA